MVALATSAARHVVVMLLPALLTVDAGALRHHLREEANGGVAAGPAAAVAAASPATPVHHMPHDVEHSGSPGEDKHGRDGAPMVPRSHVPIGHTAPTVEHWTYAAPLTWGQGYAACDGEMQSPVNIEWEKASANAEEEDVEYIAHNAKYHPLKDRKLENNGHNVQVDGHFGHLTLPDGDYDVAQFHFHFPSEHEVNGKLAAGEIHIVHQKQGSKGTDDLAVVAILLETDERVKEELDFLENLGFGGQLPKEHEDFHAHNKVDLNAFAATFKLGFWHYRGSLTTPPCSETVHWYVMQQPASVTPVMLESFKALFPSPSNNRPVQPLGDRNVVFSEAAEPGEFSHYPAYPAEPPVAHHPPKSAALRAGALAALAAAGLRALLL